MNYKQARDFITEISKYGSVYGLSSIRALMERLGNVQERLRILHVAGTNGKGSVCAMLAAVLQAAGYRTGVYASPAVWEPEEIIKVNGQVISQEDFAALAQKVQAACRDLFAEGLPHPTAFEVETAIAFCFFDQQECDYVVLETGLGGASDATNLITHPVCSILTSISMDHMALLGNTLEEIAAAKAGIIKPGCPCVSAPQNPKAARVLAQAAQEKGSVLRMADPSRIQVFSYDGQKSWFEADVEPQITLYGQEKPQSAACQERWSGTLGLTGACQKENLACVLEVVRLLREQGIRITRDAFLKGLAGVHLPGRMEQIGNHPDFYLDGAHNEGAAYCLRETAEHCFANRRIVFILGVFADKEYEKVLKMMLPYAAAVFTITPDHPRALDAEQLAGQARLFCQSVTSVPDLAQAAAQAEQAAGDDGVVLAFGSFSYLADLKKARKVESRQKNG